MLRSAALIGLMLSGAALAAVLGMAISQQHRDMGDPGISQALRTASVVAGATDNPPELAGAKSPAMDRANLPVPKGDIVREMARAPLSPLAAPPPPAPPPDPDSLPRKWRLIHQTVATAAGVLDTDGLTLVLPGIDAVASNEMCVRAGLSWPCGMAARTAFRAYLRGRALNCRVPDKRLEITILAECLLQGEDPARWLVSAGWARAKPDGPFVEEGKRALKMSKGIFGPPVN